MARRSYIEGNSNLPYFHPQLQSHHTLELELPAPQKFVSVQSFHSAHILDSMAYRNPMHKIRCEKENSIAHDLCSVMLNVTLTHLFS